MKNNKMGSELFESILVEKLNSDDMDQASVLQLSWHPNGTWDWYSHLHIASYW